MNNNEGTLQEKNRELVEMLKKCVLVWSYNANQEEEWAALQDACALLDSIGERFTATVKR